MLAAFSPDAGPTLRNGLVAYYSGASLTPQWGGLVLTDHASVAFNAGKVGNAFDFGTSNTTKYLSSGKVTSLIANFSFFCWVYLPTASEKGSFVSNGYAGAANGWSLGVGSAANYTVLGNNLIGHIPGIAWLTFGATIGTGWHFVGFTRAASTWTGYIDNVACPNTFSSTPGAAADVFNIGAAAGSYQLTAGMIDELGIWNRVLTAQERTDLYNAGNGNTLTPATTAKYFTVDPDSSLEYQLAHYYPLEDVNDYFSTGHLTNPNSGAFNAAKVNNGFLSATGSKQLVTSGVSPFTDIDNFTVAGWVNLSGTNIQGTFIGLGVSRGWCVGVGNSQLLNTGNNLILYMAAVAWCPFGSFGGSGWKHFAVVRDAGTSMGYVNGVKLGTTYTNVPLSINETLTIGGIVVNNLPFSGLVDEVGLWHRPLGVREIEALYNAGAGSTMTQAAAPAGGVPIFNSQYRRRWAA